MTRGLKTFSPIRGGAADRRRSPRPIGHRPRPKCFLSSGNGLFSDRAALRGRRIGRGIDARSFRRRPQVVSLPVYYRYSRVDNGHGWPSVPGQGLGQWRLPAHNREDNTTVLGEDIGYAGPNLFAPLSCRLSGGEGRAAERRGIALCRYRICWLTLLGNARRAQTAAVF